jgi:hypothetical protein
MGEHPLEKMAILFDKDVAREADIYFRWGFEKVAGNVVSGFVGLEIEVDGRRFTVLHYDNSHGQPFHRHSPGFPRSGQEKTDLSALDPNQWIRYARDEMKMHWRRWVNSVVPVNVKGYIASHGATGRGDMAPGSENED